MTSKLRNRVSAGGSLRIDRLLKRLGLPRLQLASGTASPREFKQINDLITRLIRLKDVALLTALIGRRVTPLELLAHGSRPGGLDELRAKIDGRSHAPSTQTVRSYSAATVLGVAVTTETTGQRSATSDGIVPSGHRATGAIARHAADAEGVVPLWPLLLSPEIWSGAKGNERTTIRHRQALRGMRTRLLLASASTETRDRLGQLTGREWYALGHVRRRGVSVSQVRDIIRNGWVPRRNKAKARSTGDARPYSMANREPAAPQAPDEVMRLRLGRETLVTLSGLDHEMWEALEAVGPDVPALDVWEAIEGASDANRQLLLELGAYLHADASVGDLPRATKRHWTALRDAWGGSRTDWNKARVALGAALSLALGYDGIVERARIMGVIPVAKEVERTPDLTAELFQQVIDTMDEPWQSMFITLVASGMRVGEYLRCTESDLLHNTRTIRVPGTKTADAAAPVVIAPRYWPMVTRAIPCPVGYTRLRHEWMRAIAKLDVRDVRLHDLRHCHGQWAVDLGVAERDVQASLRHMTPGQTRRYTRKRQTSNVADALAGLNLSTKATVNRGGG